MRDQAATILSLLPPPVQKMIGPEGADKQKRLVARALVPMLPNILVYALTYLSLTGSDEIKRLAEEGLEGTPAPIIIGLLEEETVPEVLHFLALFFLRERDYLKAIALNRAADNLTIEKIAEKCSHDVCQIIGLNQERIIAHPPIVKALYFNPNTSTMMSSKAVETAVRNGINLEGIIPGAREIVASILGDDAVEPEEGEDPSDAPRAGDRIEGDATTGDPTDQGEAPAASGIDHFQDTGFLDMLVTGDSEVGTFYRDLAKASSELTATLDGELDIKPVAAVEQDEEKRSGNLQALIREMSISEKVRLAMMGNNTARGILIKDPKKVVAVAVLRSPRITERDIANYARNRTLGDDVIRTIANNREWTKNYAIKLSLVENPKTPPGIAMRFLMSLNPNDLKGISKNRDVSAAVSRQARTIITQREERKRKRMNK